MELGVGEERLFVLCQVLAGVAVALSQGVAGFLFVAEHARQVGEYGEHDEYQGQVCSQVESVALSLGSVLSRLGLSPSHSLPVEVHVLVLETAPEERLEYVFWVEELFFVVTARRLLSALVRLLFSESVVMRLLVWVR